MPSPEQLDAHYGARSRAGNYELVKRKERVATTEGVVAEVQRFAGSGGRIFDIGCFDGLLLDIAATQGWETWGLEMQSSAAEMARVKHGGRVHIQTIESFVPTPTSYFDAVTAIGVIEHVRWHCCERRPPF